MQNTKYFLYNFSVNSHILEVLCFKEYALQKVLCFKEYVLQKVLCFIESKRIKLHNNLTNKTTQFYALQKNKGTQFKHLSFFFLKPEDWLRYVFLETFYHRPKSATACVLFSAKVHCCNMFIFVYLYTVKLLIKYLKNNVLLSTFF